MCPISVYNPTALNNNKKDLRVCTFFFINCLFLTSLLATGGMLPSYDYSSHSFTCKRGLEHNKGNGLTIQVLYFWVQKYAILSYADLIALLLQDYVIVTLLLSYTKEPLGLREYGNVAGYLVAIASVYFGTVSKAMIVGVMVSGVFVAGWILDDQTVMMQRLLNFFCNITILFLVFYFKNGNKKEEEKKKE
eukprot:sb/3471091/